MSSTPGGVQLAADLQNVELIIWNDFVMGSLYCVDAVDHSMPDLARSPRPPAIQVVLFSGGFLHILPDIRGELSSEIFLCMRKNVSNLSAVSNTGT